jgi:glycosyltransferase involved in cell wall biosynthesis
MTDRRRILFSLLDAGLGGGQRVATWFAEAARARGHEVGLLVPATGPTSRRFEALGARIHLARLQRLREPGELRQASLTLREYDVLWSHTAIGGQVLGDLAARLARRPHVLHQHTFPQFASREPERMLQRSFCRALLGRRPFIAVAPHVHDGLVAAGIDRSGIRVVPNGVPILQPAPPRDTAPVRVGLLGRFDPGKGMLEFVEAAMRTGLAPDEATFTIGGSGGPFTSYETELRDRAAGAGFISIEEPGDDGVGYLARQDIVVLPSRYEGSPLALLEAMALGKAVIATDIPGVTGITGSPGPVTLVPVGDVAALANAIRDVVREPRRRSAEGTAARELVTERFSVESMTQAALDYVGSVAAGHGRR